MKQKLAFITGVTGQDGAYLAKLLLDKNYRVIGILRKNNSVKLQKLDYLKITSNIIFENCDLTSLSEVMNLINKYKPVEIYNLASQSSVGLSFSSPIETLSFNTLSTASILEAIRLLDKTIKFYQASSSEMFGSTNELPFTEKSILHPVSPYGISKASAHWITVNYRESFGLFTTSGILFNHESVLRENHFIIKKIIRTSLEIANDSTKVLEVGDIDIKRDFGYAPKYVEAMFLMMQKEKPDDYIIASGKSISIREIIYYIFEKLGISKDKIIINKDYFRPNEIKDIYGDTSKAKENLGWDYDYDFFHVIDILIGEEMQVIERNK